MKLKFLLFICACLSFGTSADAASAIKKSAVKKPPEAVLPQIRPVPFSAPQVQEIVTPSGIRAWLIEEKNTPVIAVSLLFKGGSAADSPRLNGLSDLVASLLDEGAGSYDASEFQEILAETGVAMTFSAATDYFSASLETLRTTREQAFDLFRLALTRPRFDRKAVRRVKKQMMTAIDARKGNPNALASERFFKLMFKNHPYEKINPDKKGLNEITRANLTRYVRERFAADNLVVGVSGNISKQELTDLLEKNFASLPKKAVLRAVEKTTPQQQGGTDVLSETVMQSAVVFGHQGIPRDAPDFYAAYIVMHILSGGDFGSRLFREVREKRGLTYGISAHLSPMNASALIVGGAAADNAKMAELIQVVKEQWRKMAQNGPTQRELDDTKTYLNGSFPLMFTSSAGLANFLASMQYYGLGADYLNKRAALFDAVTLKQAKETAARILLPDNLFFVVIGKPANL